MKFTTFLFYIFCLYIQNLSAQTVEANTQRIDEFYYELIYNEKTLSSLVSINIQSPTFEGKVVTTRANFQGFLLKTQNMEWSESQKYLYNLLVNGDTLKTNSNIDSSNGHYIRFWPFRKVSANQHVQEYIEKGQEEFLKHFFKQESDSTGAYKDMEDHKDIDYEYLSTSITDQLFKWKIFVFKEGYSGRLRYYIPK
jgi:hypothetical protein